MDKNESSHEPKMYNVELTEQELALVITGVEALTAEPSLQGNRVWQRLGQGMVRDILKKLTLIFSRGS